VDDPPAARVISRSGATALAAASAGLFAMALVAAAPGSPYHPLLTTHGQPHGPLRDLAVAIGLADVHGNASIAIATVVSVLAVGGFLVLLRASFRREVGVRAIAILVVAAHGVLLLLPLLFSRDVYSYAFYGRIAGIYGGNPYVHTPLDHSGDLLWRYVGPHWVDTPAVYGPAWTSLSAGLSRFLPRPVDHVDAYRLIAIVASLLTCAAIVWVVRREWPARTAFALAVFGANPVVLFHSVASGHNDLIVALAIVVGLGLAVRGHARTAVAVLTIGALVKATVALPLLLLIVWCVARRAPGTRLRALLPLVAVVGVLGIVFALPYMQTRDPTLGMLELAGHEGWLAPSMAFSRALDFVSGDRLGWIPRVVFGVVLVVTIGALVREVWRRGARVDDGELAAAWGWALLLLTLLGPVLLPWYVVWSLPLAWALPKVPRTTLLAVSAMLAVTLWSTEPMRFPGAFELDTLIGRWVVTPIVLVLLVRTLLDLRSRIRIGLPLDEETLPPAPTPVGEMPGDQQPVAAGAG
jgi:alpha-1,6-mannosyltransferase